MGWLAFIAACIIASFLSFLWRRKKFADSLPPGPPALPLIGNLLQIDKKDARKTFLEWHKKYGPVFTVWFGNVPNVFVTGADLMQELFVKRGDEFAYRPYTYIFELFSKGKYGIINSNGELWKEQRRFCLHTFRNFGFGRKIMEEKIQMEMSKMIESLNGKIGAENHGNFDMKPFLDICISNIISSVIIGRTYEVDDPIFVKFSKALEDNVQDFGKLRLQFLNTFPWLRHVPLFGRFGYTDLVKNIDNFLGVLNDEIAERKRHVTNAERTESEYEPTDFVGAYWHEMKRREKSGEGMGYFDDWQLTAICGDVWAAGLGTTVITLYWAMLLMMHYPEVQEKVQQEIDAQVGQERAPSMTDKIRMPYTSAVVNEIQRYGNILTVNIPRTVTADTKISAYTIPPGVAIVPQIAVLHYDETVYENPTDFDPGRFLEADGKSVKKSTENLLPFSLGKRQCMGESLARMELFLIFANILQRFSLKFVAGESTPTIKPIVSFNCFPKPYKVCISRR